jgi:bacteriochlorophyllide a dehydrogenase
VNLNSLWEKLKSMRGGAPSAARARAVVFTGPRKVEVRDVPVPQTGEHDVAVETLASAISVGTERWALMGLRPDVAFPCIPGYLGIGLVTGFGAKVTNFKVGDRVNFLAARCPDGYGGNWMCSHLARGVVSCDPAIYIPEADVPYCLLVPDGVPDEEAALAGLAGVSQMGVDMAQIQQGEKVAVFGLGPIGQFAAQLARLAGATVLAADVAECRIEIASKTGIDAALNVRATGFESNARQFAPQGFDVIIDTTGSADALNTEIAFLRNHGRFVFQGWYPGMSQLNLHNFTLKLTHALFPCGVRGGDVAKAMQLMADGKLLAAPLITHRWKPDDAPRAYDGVLENDPAALAQVFVWKS